MSEPRKVKTDPKPGPVAPGDEAAPGTSGTGEVDCPECHGTGKSLGTTCGNCAGTGRVVVGVGGA